jgi:hypothetical protein
MTTIFRQRRAVKPRRIAVPTKIESSSVPVAEIHHPRTKTTAHRQPFITRKTGGHPLPIAGKGFVEA